MFKELGGKAAAKMVKPFVGPILTVVVAEIIKAGGGNIEGCACMLWHTKRKDGKPTVMAKVYRLNDMDEPTELIGIVDVLLEAEALDLTQFIQ